MTEENTPYILANNETFGLYNATAEKVYSIKLPGMSASNGGFMIRKDDLTAAGLADKYTDYQLVTLDDLSEIFAEIKAVYPEKYPCGIIGAATRADQTFIYDALADAVTSGVLIGLESTTVENYYTSEPYVDYLKHAREWYLNGYIPKDAATTDISLSNYLKEGIISGYFNDFKDRGMKINTGCEFVYLQLKDYYKASVAPASSIYFGVPVTAKEPEAAVRFIDLMYRNADIGNLFTWGIEGSHYVVKSDENGTKYIEYPDGIDATNSGYPYGYGFYINNTLEDAYTGFGPSDPTVLTTDEILQRAEGRVTKGRDFVYDSSAWTTQLQMISDVVAQYKTSLECGAADLDTVYPEFIASLEANGINDIIADKQAAFDAWLAE